MKNTSSSIDFNHVSLYAKKNKKNLIKVFSKIIDKGEYLSGSHNKQLTQTLETFLKRGKVTVCASGHDALFLALSSLDLKKTMKSFFQSMLIQQLSLLL